MLGLDSAIHYGRVTITDEQYVPPMLEEDASPAVDGVVPPMLKEEE